jgi:hypothetical protein
LPNVPAIEGSAATPKAAVRKILLDQLQEARLQR